ncbi:carbonic anhydrase family protein [Hydrogenophaga sp. 5NK40-0174]|uniref:carbonic anhydrase n=1 Tax=Hydrogenophaga sp. 5NK40-0174 TaxID=3127649 RepID=UPI00333F9596
MNTRPTHPQPGQALRPAAKTAALATPMQWRRLSRWIMIAGFGLGLSFLFMTKALAESGGHGSDHDAAHAAPAAAQPHNTGHEEKPVHNSDARKPDAHATEHASEHAKDAHGNKPHAEATPAAEDKPELPANHPRAVAERLRKIVEKHSGGKGEMTLLIGNETLEERHAAMAAARPQDAADAPGDSHGGGHIEVISPREKQTSHAPHGKTRAHSKKNKKTHKAHSAVAHWDYTGETGPANWGSMKPEFSTCDSGQRQSPIHIQSMDAMPGPAEPIEFHYMPSGGNVVNNGHTIQVNPMGHNYIKVRGDVYQLVQFHFHHPAEEKVNYKGFAMVAHLVHKNQAGQLAVVAILMDVGHENPLVRKVWTHMPLDVNDRVGLPDETVDLFELLPSDQRYFQFMGSLTTPPCTEGVLWLVIKQPVTVGPQQLRAFSRIFPMNARPTQELNGRLVREGM